MAERKNLTIIQVKEIEKIGDRQIPKLSFRASDGDGEHWYQTFKSSLFELIKEGQTINADVETQERGEYTNRRIVQVYVDGQPVVSKGAGFSRGKSPEELELSAKSYALSYAKDLVIAKVIPFDDITIAAKNFYAWMKGNGDKPASRAKTSQVESSPVTGEDEFIAIPSMPSEETKDKAPPTGKKVQNIAELKSLLMKHKIGTHETYEILSIKAFTDLKDLDEAWADIKKAKGIE